MTLTDLKKTILKFKPLYPILGGLLIISLILGAFKLRPRPIEVIQISPADLTPNVSLTAPIVITLNQGITDPNQIHFSLTPINPGSVTIQGDQIFFTPNTPYQPQTNYRLTITGARLKSISTSFTTQTALPQTGSGFNRYLPAPTPIPGTPRDEFLKTLPYRTDTYTIRYLKTSNILDIQLHTLPQEESLNQAILYIKSFGVQDPYLQFNINYDLDPYINPNTNVLLELTPSPQPITTPTN